MLEEEKHKLPGEPSESEELRFAAELRANLKALALLKPGDLRAVCIIDPSERLLSLVPFLKRPIGFVTVALANMVHSAVLRVSTEPKGVKGAAIRLRPNAIQAARIVLTAAVQALASTIRTSRRKSGKQLEKFAVRCAKTMALCSELSELPTAWTEAIKYAREASSITSSSFESFLSEQNLGRDYERFEQGTIEAVNYALSEGDIVTLTDLSETLRRHQDIRNATHRRVTALMSERAGSLPTESQAWALRELGLSVTEAKLEYSDPADSPEIRQAASLLMSMLDGLNGKTELKDLFDRFRSLCEAHFHLFLRGDVGIVTQFDSRIHEPCDNTRSQVRLVRPWVEWYLPPKARIVIRGIVEPAD